jgi:hypothetical protein
MPLGSAARTWVSTGDEEFPGTSYSAQEPGEDLGQCE